MTEEIREYAQRRIRESGIRMVHCPDFGYREDVDKFIEIASYLSMKGAKAKTRQKICMTNKEVSEAFTDIYNGFWMRHRDSLPALSDDAGWDAVVREAWELMEKHDSQLARDMVGNVMAIMDQRQRDKEREINGG